MYFEVNTKKKKGENSKVTPPKQGYRPKEYLKKKTGSEKHKKKNTTEGPKSMISARGREKHDEEVQKKGATKTQGENKSEHR